MCASGYMGCLANTKGILVMSSNSVTVLGLIVGGAAPLPLRPVAGVAGPVSAKGAPPVAIVRLQLVRRPLTHAHGQRPYATVV